MDPGVSVYSKKVLIQHKARGILPYWLRFVKGVVDSPDIPLNLSREHFQDSLLIKRINTLLTRRILKFLLQELKENPHNYDKFFSEFGNFLKEAICTDNQWKIELSKLLRFESSKTKPGKFKSFEEYISQMPASQKEIYFLCAPDRDFAESSPYFEYYKKNDHEVLFVYTSLDDFVMNNLQDYDGKKLVSVETSRDDLTQSPQTPETANLIKWIEEILQDRVYKVKVSTRLDKSPAVIVDHPSAAVRKMMRFVDLQKAEKLPKQTLEINPNHPFFQKAYQLNTLDSNLAQQVIHQVMDNALIAAGLLDDPRQLLPRLNFIIESALGNLEQPEIVQVEQPDP